MLYSLHDFLKYIFLSEPYAFGESIKKDVDFSGLPHFVYLPMRNILGIILLNITISATSQIRIVNKDATNGAAIIFDGITNHLIIEGAKETDLLGFQGFGLRFTPTGRRTILVTPTDADSSRFVIFKEIKGVNKTIAEQKFQVEFVGEPSVYFVQKPDTIYPSNKQVANLSRLEVSVPNKNYVNTFQVEHFEMSVTGKDGNVVMPSTFVSGNYPGETIMQKIQSLEKGAVIRFDQIVIRCAGCPFQKTGPLIIEQPDKRGYQGRTSTKTDTARLTVEIISGLTTRKVQNSERLAGEETYTVAIRVTVNEKGVVTEAILERKGTNTTNPSIVQSALKTARLLKFSPGSNVDTGVVKFAFNEP
jgi:hypothetical protein